jgi:hypothetical protein
MLANRLIEKSPTNAADKSNLLITDKDYGKFQYNKIFNAKRRSAGADDG